MRVLVATFKPPGRTLLGTTPSRWTVAEWEGRSIDDAIDQAIVPLDGEVKLCPIEHVVTVRSRVGKEVVPS